MNEDYKKQVSLLLSVLPEILKEDCFALHGGTAINLFLREMPRLSVDIDLTYLPMKNRQAALDHISKALESAKARILFTLPGVSVNHQRMISKLLVSGNGASIKVGSQPNNQRHVRKAGKTDTLPKGTRRI